MPSMLKGRHKLVNGLINYGDKGMPQFFCSGAADKHNMPINTRKKILNTSPICLVWTVSTADRDSRLGYSLIHSFICIRPMVHGA